TILVMDDLSHVDESGAVRMVDVGGKEPMRRRAIARAEVRMAAETTRKLRELPKGDALATAQLAGIMAAKRTSELIPLCHPLPLTNVEVTIGVREESVEIVSVVETTAQTGVEMEALTAASVLALTTGGTGLAPRDVTPEATRDVLEREAPGIAQALRADSIAKTPHGLLSRGAAGVLGSTLVVNLPGSTGGCRDGFAVLQPALAHALELLADAPTAHEQT